MWHPGFTYERAEPARLDGWARRFWQGSTDHRGTDLAPGRVVTLLPDPQGQCIGMAYEIDPQGAADTLGSLDVREQGGYRREQVPVVLHSGVRVSVLTYLAGPSNPNFLGPADLAVMAGQIAQARGPSGTNLEYLLLLEHALVEAGARDIHVTVLMAAVRGRLQKTGDPRVSLGRTPGPAGEHGSP